MKGTRLILLLLGITCLSIACSSDPLGNKHVLVIGIDGLRPDALQAADTPSIDALIAHGCVSYNAFAGGVLAMPTQQPTVSGPGWISILTGVWVNKHNVNDNKFEQPNYQEYPHFFKRIKESLPDAYLSSIVTWEPIHHFILSDEDFRFTTFGDDYAKMDSEATDIAAGHLLSADPDVLFFYLGNVDEIGHEFGYGVEIPEYMKALEAADAQVGLVIGAVKSRPNSADEDWLVIVTTDHGAIGNGHGRQTVDERTIFFITSGRNAKRGIVSPGPGHAAVAPTVFEYLGIPIKPEWGWEETAFGLNENRP